MGSWRRLAGFGLTTASLIVAWIALGTPLISPAEAAGAGTATLTIRIENVDPKGGTMRLGLYDAARYAHDGEPVMGADVPAEAGATTITLSGLAPGTYAIEAYQDLNSNDKMDKNWLGLPLEPYGFSRDAKPLFSKPRFKAVEFAVTPGENFQGLHLQNSVSVVAAE